MCHLIYNIHETSLTLNAFPWHRQSYSGGFICLQCYPSFLSGLRTKIRVLMESTKIVLESDKKGGTDRRISGRAYGSPGKWDSGPGCPTSIVFPTQNLSLGGIPWAEIPFSGRAIRATNKAANCPSFVYYYIDICSLVLMHTLLFVA